MAATSKINYPVNCICTLREPCWLLNPSIFADDILLLNNRPYHFSFAGHVDHPLETGKGSLGSLHRMMESTELDRVP